MKNTEQIIAEGLKEYLQGMMLLQEKKNYTCALIIAYSLIDLCGALTREDPQVPATGNDFKRWTKDYILTGVSGSYNENDLWAGRCGLVHAYTPQANDVKRNRARAITYVTSPEDLTEFIQEELNKTNEVVVQIFDFLSGLTDAITKFLQELKRNAELKEKVYRNSEDLFIHLNYKILG